MTATKEICIKVTQEDIDNGIPESSRSCPIALAVKRQFPDWDYVNVASYIEAFATNGMRRFSLPDEAVNFIAAFDEGPVSYSYEDENDAEGFEYVNPLYEYVHPFEFCATGGPVS